jgi:hypothetical protein
MLLSSPKIEGFNRPFGSRRGALDYQITTNNAYLERAASGCRIPTRRPSARDPLGRLVPMRPSTFTCLNFGPAVAQSDDAIEDEALERAVEICAEIALSFELYRLSRQ